MPRGQLKIFIGHSSLNNDTIRERLINAFPEFMVDVQEADPQPVTNQAESAAFANPPRYRMVIVISVREPDGREPGIDDMRFASRLVLTLSEKRKAV